MGVTLSTQSTLAPVSLASTIIGFISFTFTLLTFLRVFWSEILSIISAPREIDNVLSNLRRELYEERDHLRLARRRCRHTDYDEVSLRIMSDTIRDLIKEFKSLEYPFLLHPRLDKDADLERGLSRYRVDYKNVGLIQRILWTKKRSDFLEISNIIQKLMIRRIGKQMNDVMSGVKDVSRTSGIIDDIDDTVYTMNEKLSRVVGVRRSD